ncbi:MAG: hypothetical protein IKR73_00210 [Oscillospiraceae bacterium]|nr:hypothetical protein [Oscillospiraceae bacterium]
MRYGKQKPALRFRLSFVFLFVIASFVGCFVMYMRGEEGDPLMKDTGVPKVITVVSEQAEQVVAPEIPVINPVPLSGRAEDGYMQNALFAGDPFITGIYTYGLTDHEHVLVINEDTDLSDAIKDKTWSSIYLLFSPSDISDSSARDAFIGDTAKLLKKIRSLSKTDIYIVSVLPLPAGSKGDNADVDTLNSMLLDLCNEQNIYYIDENTYLKGSDGRLRSSYSDRNGLTEQAYKAIFEMIRTHTAIKER